VQLTIQNDALVFSNGEDPWKLELSQLVVVGEYTTPEGPGADDHFLVLVEESGTCREVAFDLENLPTILVELSRYFDFKIQGRLANRTDFASVVLWPPQLVGTELFRFSTEVPQSLLGRLGRLLGIDRTRVELSLQVKRYISAHA
jgi:hypothetical protein